MVLFIKYLDSRSDKFLVSVRNDDSKMLLDQFFDGSSLKNIIQIPDGGFFTSAGEYRHPEIPDDKTVIAINTVRDRMEDRWGDKESYNQYCKNFLCSLTKLSQEILISTSYLCHISHLIYRQFQMCLMPYKIIIVEEI